MLKIIVIFLGFVTKKKITLRCILLKASAKRKPAGPSPFLEMLNHSDSGATSV